MNGKFSLQKLKKNTETGEFAKSGGLQGSSRDESAKTCHPDGHRSALKNCNFDIIDFRQFLQRKRPSLEKFLVDPTGFEPATPC